MAYEQGSVISNAPKVGLQARLSQVVNRFKEAHTSMESLASALYGPVPMDASTEPKRSVDSVDSLIDDLHATADRMEQTLSRIHNRL